MNMGDAVNAIEQVARTILGGDKIEFSPPPPKNSSSSSLGSANGTGDGVNGVSEVIVKKELKKKKEDSIEKAVAKNILFLMVLAKLRYFGESFSRREGATIKDFEIFEKTIQMVDESSIFEKLKLKLAGFLSSSSENSNVVVEKEDEQEETQENGHENGHFLDLSEEENQSVKNSLITSSKFHRNPTLNPNKNILQYFSIENALSWKSTISHVRRLTQNMTRYGPCTNHEGCLKFPTLPKNQLVASVPIGYDDFAGNSGKDCNAKGGRVFENSLLLKTHSLSEEENYSPSETQDSNSEGRVGKTTGMGILHNSTTNGTSSRSTGAQKKMLPYDRDAIEDCDHYNFLFNTPGTGTFEVHNEKIEENNEIFLCQRTGTCSPDLLNIGANLPRAVV